MKTFKTSLVVAFLSSCFALVVATSSPAHAECKDLPPPKMVIKIFNRDPKLYVFPVLTMGKGPVDTWLQSCFKVPADNIGANPFPRGKNFRLYAFPATGIAPQKRDSDPVASIVLTLPLYTQMVSSVVPTAADQYIDWWQGGTIQLYTSETASPPKALLDAMAGKNEGQDQKEETPAFGGAVRPDCPACQQPLKIFSDVVDLPKNDPSQLIEFTLGAQQVLLVKNPATDPPKKLDLRNVDFDVSYVNVAYMPAAMGPYQNDQVGYVGTPQSIKDFQDALNQFLKSPKFKGWPRFIKTYADKSKETILKLPSPLELFARLTGKDAPSDLEPPPSWPSVLWKPVEEMRSNWTDYAGKFNGDGICKATTKKDTFCDAIVDSKKFMKANYASYRANFGSKCAGSPLELSDELLISHVYGWTPFNESTVKDGCAADFNLLHLTPGYEADMSAEYLRVKQAFDLLNYDKLPGSKYTFNPWVVLIHGGKSKNDQYIGAPNVYAYSVDDAVGNIQAEGGGFIIDIGSTKDLENQRLAEPPININIGAPIGNVSFKTYRVCSDDQSRDKDVNEGFYSFVVNANDPDKCPVFLYDNKSPPQRYTFRITEKDPKKLAFVKKDAAWDKDTTAKPIDCTGNAIESQKGMTIQTSSRNWCCQLLAVGGNGVIAFQQPSIGNIHFPREYFAVTPPPKVDALENVERMCSAGKAIPLGTVNKGKASAVRR